MQIHTVSSHRQWREQVLHLLSKNKDGLPSASPLTVASASVFNITVVVVVVVCSKAVVGRSTFELLPYLYVYVYMEVIRRAVVLVFEFSSSLSRRRLLLLLAAISLEQALNCKIALKTSDADTWCMLVWQHIYMAMEVKNLMSQPNCSYGDGLHLLTPYVDLYCMMMHHAHRTNKCFSLLKNWLLIFHRAPKWK